MQGVIAAVPTPIDANGSPIGDLFKDHCQWALANGCDGLNILGSTGEANSFDQHSRRLVMQWAVDTSPRDKLMVGTGTPSLRETQDLTQYAADLGYPVALVLPPYYYKPVSDEGLITWYMALHDALGTRDIAIYFYNFPQLTGLNIPVSVISHLAKAAPERFRGIKDSSGDLDYARAVLTEVPHLSVFPSSETALQHVAKDRFAGCISATVNVTGPTAGEIWAARQAPPAHAIAKISAQRDLMAGPELIPSVKAMVAHRTGMAQWLNVLPPFTPLRDPTDLAKRLKEV